MDLNYANPRHSPPGDDGSFNPASLFRRALTILWQGIVGLMIPVGVAVLMGFLFFPALGPMFGFGAALIMFVIARSISQARLNRGLLVLSHVKQAVELNLPLPQTLRNWSLGETPQAARGLRRVAETIEAGASVAQAMESSNLFLPPRVIDQIISGERAGRLATAMSQVLIDERQRRLTDSTRWSFVRAYGIILLIAIPSIIAMLMIFVIPKFETIFKDFRTPMPGVTVALLRLSSGVTGSIALIVAVVLWIVACTSAANEIFRRRPLRRMLFIKTPIDYLRWIFPIVRRIDCDCGLADVCGTIADSLDAQRTVPVAVHEASQPHLNVVLAKRVKAWATNIEQGQPFGRAAEEAKLPSLISGLLGTVRTAPDVVGVLRFLERYYRARFSRIATILQEAAVPILTVTAAIFVCWVALAIFAPMTQLLQSVEVPLHGSYRGVTNYYGGATVVIQPSPPANQPSPPPQKVGEDL